MHSIFFWRSQRRLMPWSHCSKRAVSLTGHKSANAIPFHNSYVSIHVLVFPSSSCDKVLEPSKVPMKMNIAIGVVPHLSPTSPEETNISANITRLLLGCRSGIEEICSSRGSSSTVHNREKPLLIVVLGPS